MARLARALAWLIAAVVAAITVAAVATARRGDGAFYPAKESGVEAYVVTNGFHSGIAVSRAAIDEIAARQGLAALTMVATRFAGYPWLEIGYGEEAFYRSVPTVAAINPRVVLQALLRPGNVAVLHVVGIDRVPPAAFREATTLRLNLSEEGFGRLAARVDASFAPRPSGLPAEELGPGLYGPSLFYRARGTFNLFHLCNHWVADVLDAAGVPTTPVVDTLAAGLVLDLEWRAGAIARAPGSAGS